MSRDLREEFEEFREYLMAEYLGSKFNEIVARLDDLELTQSRHDDELAALRDRIDTLEQQLDLQVGVEDATASTPEKRARDLRKTMIREARDRQDQFNGRLALWWQQVQGRLSTLGHGQTSKPDCYKAMHWAAGEQYDGRCPLKDIDGFEMAKTTNADGRNVTAIRVKLDALPPEVASRSPTTRKTQSTGVNKGETTANVTTTNQDD